MSEKNILSYFHRPEDAKKAEQEIQSLGAEATKVEEVGKFHGEGIERIIDPVNSDFDSLATLTLAGNPSERNTGILMAADVSASGMSAGDRERALSSDPNYLLTAVVDEKMHKEALKIVEKYGGIV